MHQQKNTLSPTPPANILGNHLRQDNLLDPSSLQTALTQATQQGLNLANYLVKNNILSSETLFHCCQRHSNLPIFNLQHYDINWLKQSTLNPELICRYHALPLSSDSLHLQLAISDPWDNTAISAISFHTGLKIQPVLVPEAALNDAIISYCQPNTLHSQLATTLLQMQTLEEPPPNTEYTENTDEPVIEFVNQLLQDAIDKQVSDIHLEPYKHHYRVRFRCHGILSEAAIMPLHLANRVLTRLKIMAQLNIAERRLPQDGRIDNIRVNTCPTLHNEKMVLRILSRQQNIPSIHTLGLDKHALSLLLAQLKQPQGLILVTGPTGSGKTVTLYAALQYLNSIDKNISTIEDPVEIEMPGINQVNINPSIGLSFASILKHLLRQDPDIIMLGEIRDTDTAAIAMQAAQTGHLVLATLHTNSAAETIIRLQSMGIPPYQLASSISLIIAQRLVRQLCQQCKQLDTKNNDGSFIATGCKHCFHGYQGRTGIFDLLTEIHSPPTPEKDNRLREAGMRLIRNGITSHAELQRVLGT